MNSNNLVIKDLVIGGLIAILSFPLPRIEKLNGLNDYLFQTAFVVMAASNLILRKFSFKEKKELVGIDFPFLKLGISLTGVSLLTVPLGAADSVKFITILITFIALIVSLIFERKEPSIFIIGDEMRHNHRLKILSLLILTTILLAAIHWLTGAYLVLMLTYSSFFLSFSGGVLMVVWFIYRIFKMH